jgi:hypothetical protein
MKNTINFSVLNNAAQYRSNNPLVNAILVLAILVAIPVIIVVGIIVLITILTISRVRAIVKQSKGERIKQQQTSRVEFERRDNAASQGEFADYVIVDEEIAE